MEVRLDIAALVAAVVTPLVVFIVIWLYRDFIRTLIQELPRRIKSFSAGAERGIHGRSLNFDREHERKR